MWRHGPYPYKDLCNSCGVKWKRGRILQNVARTLSKDGRPMGGKVWGSVVIFPDEEGFDSSFEDKNPLSPPLFSISSSFVSRSPPLYDDTEFSSGPMRTRSGKRLQPRPRPFKKSKVDHVKDETSSPLIEPATRAQSPVSNIVKAEIRNENSRCITIDTTFEKRPHEMANDNNDTNSNNSSNINNDGTCPTTIETTLATTPHDIVMGNQAFAHSLDESSNVWSAPSPSMTSLSSLLPPKLNSLSSAEKISILVQYLPHLTETQLYELVNVFRSNEESNLGFDFEIDINVIDEKIWNRIAAVLQANIAI